jgi:hypothetical protein
MLVYVCNGSSLGTNNCSNSLATAAERKQIVTSCVGGVIMILRGLFFFHPPMGYKKKTN